MIMMRLKVARKIDEGAVSKFNLPALAKTTVVGNSNSTEAFFKKM
jgi:hypothetical protein